MAGVSVVVLGSLAFVSNHASAVPARVIYLQNLDHRFTDDESSCLTALNTNIASTGGSSNFTTIRNAINSSSPNDTYNEEYWITPAGSPASNIPDQDADTSFTLNLQLNQMEFLCAILLKPNSAQTYKGNPGAAYPLDKTILTLSKFASNPDLTDYPPTPDSYNLDAASKNTIYTKILSGSGDWTSTSSCGSSSGVASNVGVNQVLTINRNTGHRYWLTSDVDTFTFKSPPGGFKCNTTITLHYVRSTTSAYHQNYGTTGAVVICSDGNGHDIYFQNSTLSSRKGDPANGRTALWDSCGKHNVYVKFFVKVRKPQITNLIATPGCDITGSASDSSRSSALLNVALYNGATLVVPKTKTRTTHTFTFSRDKLGSVVDWNAHTFTVRAYGINSAGAEDGSYVTQDVSAGPCAKIACNNVTGTGAISTGGPLTVSVKATNVTTNPPGPIPAFRVMIINTDTNAVVMAETSEAYGSSNITSSTKTNLLTSVSFGVPPQPPGNYQVQYGWADPGHTQSNVTYDASDHTKCGKLATAAYNPYFTVAGGDVAAGAPFCDENGAAPVLSAQDVTDSKIQAFNYDGSPDARGHRGYYGAGTQAAAFALDSINSFATGINPLALPGDANNNLMASLPAPAQPYKLSFANTGAGVTANGIGAYGGMFGYGAAAGVATIPCVHDYFDDNYAGDAAAIDATTLPGGVTIPDSGTVATSYSGNMTFHGTQLKAGANITLTVDGDVYIDGDITVDPTGYTAATDVPNLTIIASGGIYIADRPAGTEAAPLVKELHGTFITQGGPFATCASGPGIEQQNFNNCKDKLVVYGTVAADAIHLARSFGSLQGGDGTAVSSPTDAAHDSVSSSGGASEQFIYTPEAWLWNLAQCTGTNCLQPVAIAGLPPVL